MNLLYTVLDFSPSYTAYHCSLHQCQLRHNVLADIDLKAQQLTSKVLLYDHLTTQKQHYVQHH